MDEGTGRGHRQKIPSEKLKDTVNGKIDKVDHDEKAILPAYVAPNDPKFFQDQKEVSKQYDHTKTGANDERIDFYQLGVHVESKEKRYYQRAKRDEQTYYFHAAEPPPHYARLSDENHPQCAVEGLRNCFTRDMLGKTGEMGSYTTRANVFAREGQFYYEARILSQAAPGKEQPDKALAESQSQDKTSTNRGGIRVGFCRREHHWSENMGGNAYSYAVVCRCGTGADYGNVRFNTLMYHMSGGGAADPGDLSPGDVVGLMITLPPLEVQQKVAEGTFNSAEYPELKCGPATIKPKKGSVAKKPTKPTPKGKDKDGDVKMDEKVSKKAHVRTAIREALNPMLGLAAPPELDIIRDRNPFLHRGLTYFECPEYTPHVDMSRPTLNAKNKTVNPETGKRYDLVTEPHPNHELPHLRTLPGSKIEMWVNGKYHGTVWENLFAFLPPASSIEKSSRTIAVNGDVDDGMLGYYPAISHYTGGAVECKFDGPWWYGFQNDGPTRPDCRPVGARYNEQIVEDFVSDMVDEIYQERLYKDSDWMRKKVLQTSERISTVPAG